MMSPPLYRDAVLCALILAGLLLAGPAAKLVGKAAPAGRRLERAVAKLSKRDMNREDLEAMTAGYYEDLLRESRRVASSKSIISALSTAEWTASESQRINENTARRRGDFLYYEYKPHVRQSHASDDLATNSFGMADREYPLEKPPGTRRFALIGDSLLRGMGAPFGAGVEALLEDRLNAAHLSPQIRRYELLNFSVHGYRVTQLLETALAKAPAFQPDVYIVGLSDLSVFRSWGWHIAQLVHDGIDLKYPYLRQLVKRARVSPGDDMSSFDAKLAPYRAETVRWVLSEIKAHARRSGAGLIVVLIPTASDPEGLSPGFDDTRVSLHQLDIAYIDLFDTFAGTENLDALRVAKLNHHPNRRGHELLFQNLYRKLTGDRRLMTLAVGPASVTMASRPQ